MTELAEGYTMKDLIPLVSAIVVVLGWFITYFLNRSQKLYDIFLTKTEINLKDVCGPMFTEMEVIFEEKHQESQMRGLARFIKKLEGATSPLFLESNKQIIAQSSALKRAYTEYKNQPSQETHDFLWSSFLALQESFSSRIKEYRALLYKHYDWKYRMDRLNPVLRLLCECFRIFFVTITGFTMVAGGISLITLCELVAKKIFLVDDPGILIPYQMYIYVYTILIFMIWLFATGLNHLLIGYRIENIWIVKKEEKAMGWYKKTYANNFPIYNDPN